MKATNLFTIWAATAVLAAFSAYATDTQEAAEDDPILASFEREFNHEAPQPRPAKREAIDEDELYERINKSLQTPEAARDVDGKAS